jgi:two-component system NtrC family sensor kinase
MKLAFIKSFSLQQKFIIIAFSAVIIIMIIIVLLNIRRERTILYRDIERQGRILAETLAIPVMNDLIYEKLGIVEEGGLIDNYVTEIFRRKDIDLVYLAVLDAKGRVISHNDFNEYGKVYNDRITLKSLYSESTVVQKFIDSKTGNNVLDIATPLSIGKKRWGTLKFAVSLKSLDDEMNAVITNGIIVTLIFFTVGLVVIILLSRRFIKPITELARTMEQAGGGALDVHVDVKGKDEIALLGQNFNSMISRIRASNTQLKQTHNELLHFVRAIQKTRGDALDTKVEIAGGDEITMLCHSFNDMIERIRESNIELKKTHEKLLQSQKLASLGILVAGVAHEINNPLGGMFNCVDMLEEVGEDKEFRHKYLALIKEGLERIEATVGKLLLTSRKRKRKPQLIEIKQSLKDVYDFNEYNINNSHIKYSEKVENGINVLMDPHDFQQVITNLMINSIQSMKNGGELNITAGKNNSHVILEVSDTGEGIEEHYRDNIFDPFYTTKPPGEGTGLGLWVTYEIIKSYQGEISVSSENGKGSTFTIKLNSA